MKEVVLQEIQLLCISVKAVNLEQSPDDSEKVNKLLKNLQNRGLYSNVRTLNVNPSLDTRAGVTLDNLFTFLKMLP